MKFLKLLLTMVFITFLFGCGNKYQETQNVNTQLDGVTKKQVKQAILEITKKSEFVYGTWKMEPIDNNTIRGHFFGRKFEIIVNIPYSEKGYSINYVSVSENLKNRKGKVHHSYKRFMNDLDFRIKQNIFNAK